MNELLSQENYPSPFCSSTMRQGDQIRRNGMEESSINRFNIKKNEIEFEIQFDDCSISSKRRQINYHRSSSDMGKLPDKGDDMKMKPSQIQRQQSQIHQESNNDINSNEYPNSNKFIANNLESKVKINNNELSKSKILSVTHQIKGERGGKWKKYSMIVVYFIARFAILMKNFSSQNKFRHLSKEQFMLINDQCSNYHYYQSKKLLISKKFFFLIQFKQSLDYLSLSKLISKVSIFYKGYNIIKKKIMSTVEPDSWIKYTWDLFMLMFLISNIYYIPLEIVFFQYFDNEQNMIGDYIFDQLPIWIMLIEIFFNCKTAYFKKGVLIKQIDEIFKNYIRKRFFLDFVILLFNVLANVYEIPILKVILLIRVLKIYQILNNYAEIMSLKDSNVAIFELSKLVLFILFVGHFCACGFFILARTEKYYGYTQTWIEKFNIPLTSIDSYIASYYWACITMITVGYGDIVPTNTFERGFVIVMTLVSCGVFAYTVNSIGTIISNLSQRNAHFKVKMSQLSQFMKKRGMKIDLQMKVKKYFQYLNDESNNDGQSQEMIMSDLASDLRSEVLIDIYGKILKSKKIFSLNFSEQFINKLSLYIREIKYGPGSIIYKENEAIQQIFFILSGEVQQQAGVIANGKASNSGNCSIRTLQIGEYFGEIEFFSDTVTSCQTDTLNVVNVAVIDKHNFLEAIKQFPNDYEKFCMMRDNFNLYQSSRGMGAKCSSCGKYTHQIYKCPFIQYIPFKEQVIQKYNSNTREQPRQTYRRNDNKFQHPWLNIDILKETTIQHIIDNYESDDIDPLMQLIENINNNNFQNDSQNEDILQTQQKQRQGQQNLNQEGDQSSNIIKQQFLPQPQSKQSGVYSKQSLLTNESSSLIQSEQKRQSLENFKDNFFGCSKNANNEIKNQKIRNNKQRRSLIINYQRRRSSLKNAIAIEDVIRHRSQSYTKQLNQQKSDLSQESDLDSKLQLRQVQPINEEDSKSNTSMMQYYPGKDHSQHDEKQIPNQVQQPQKGGIIKSQLSNQFGSQTSLSHQDNNFDGCSNNQMERGQNDGNASRTSIDQKKQGNTSDYGRILNEGKKEDILPSEKCHQSLKSLDVSIMSKISEKQMIKQNVDTSTVKNSQRINQVKPSTSFTIALFSDLPELDLRFDWKIYFPHNNSVIILQQCNEKLKLSPLDKKRKLKQLNELQSHIKSKGIKYSIVRKPTHTIIQQPSQEIGEFQANL